MVTQYINSVNIDLVTTYSRFHACQLQSSLIYCQSAAKLHEIFKKAKYILNKPHIIIIINLFVSNIILNGYTFE